MYQNAPPQHPYMNGGGPPSMRGGMPSNGPMDYGYGPPSSQQQPPPPPQQPQPWGGYPHADMPPSYNPYGAPSPPPNPYGNPGGYGPVGSAYQRASAAMAGGPRGPSPSTLPSPQSASSTGLIRLTLRKPMGIVFEPMTDPHNPSQQRGVRICDLPRTGAAAMSQKLEVGDELLSINDKTMSRLTFDEIMDFIIEADAERVDLLFRRPMKEKLLDKHVMKHNQGTTLSPTAKGSMASQSVKWIDEDEPKNNESSGKSREDGRETDRNRRDGERKGRDDPSIDDTYNDGYTVESQSQYTMETYDDAYYRDERGRRVKTGGGKKGGKVRNTKDNAEGNQGTRKDPIESTSFLDMLIDTLCTSVIGRDAREMCTDRSGNADKNIGKKNSREKKGYDEDDEFTLDDGTYQADEYRDRDRRRERERERDRDRKDDDDTLVTEDEGTLVTEDDGTRTLETNDEPPYLPKKPSKQQPKRSHSSEKQEIKESHSKAKTKSKSKGNESSHDEAEDYQRIHVPVSDHIGRQSSPMEPSYDETAPDPPTKTQSLVQKQIADQIDDAGEESAVASSALPLKELEYDDRIDYAADVSVMESLGGPSLLVERSRHEQAVSSGADHAALDEGNLESADPELAELVAIHGEGFIPEPGMTKEESAFRDPYKFYEYAVCTLLQENEPEKVRLLSKLMAKYRGRERHLINKLSARYNKEAKQGGQDQVDRTKSNDIATKPSVSGMEKIHEGGEDEEASSSLNDPARANIAAIETTKKRLELATAEEAPPQNKPAADDGWPPAIADPWGTSEAAKEDEKEKDEVKENNAANPAREDESSRDRAIDDDEGSYSEGSSYSGESVDGTSPAIIAQVSELLNYVYGKTSVAGQIDRVSTIMRAYEGREAVLLELLETKALIKANADSSRDTSDLPMSLRNTPNLPRVADSNDSSSSNKIPTTAPARRSNVPPETPVSMLSDPTMAKSPTSIEYPAQEEVATPLSTSVPDMKQPLSPAEGTLDSTATGKKKKKSLFGGFFGGKKGKKNGGAFPSGASTKSSITTNTKSSKKGKLLSKVVDDRSI
ncbi:hypothetical protein ACHAXS_007256 [Conticribra weissflogii]